MKDGARSLFSLPEEWVEEEKMVFSDGQKGPREKRTIASGVLYVVVQSNTQICLLIHYCKAIEQLLQPSEICLSEARFPTYKISKSAGSTVVQGEEKDSLNLVQR